MDRSLKRRRSVAAVTAKRDETDAAIIAAQRKARRLRAMDENSTYYHANIIISDPKPNIRPPNDGTSVAEAPVSLLLDALTVTVRVH